LTHLVRGVGIGRENHPSGVNIASEFTFSAFQANVSAYVVSILAHRLGDRLDLDKIWLNQSISPQLQEQIQVWATEVNDVLHRSSGGKMISEWAKKPECWEAVLEASFPGALSNIPEVR
jgi:AIPR protein